MEEEVLKMFKEAKPKLEEKYSVRISICALRLAVHGLKYFDSSKRTSEQSIFEGVQILDGACKLVVSKFRNCDHEREFYEKAYVLRRALVELNELQNENFPATQSWVNRLILERDSASAYMKDFLLRWKKITSPSFFDWTMLCFKELFTTPHSRVRDDIRGQLIELFEPLLTVKAYHVAEVVSSSTDVPLTHILSHINSQHQKALYMMSKRVVDQERVINEISATLASQRDTTTRPRGLFLLLGSSGAGKTEIAKAFAQHWYCDESRLVHIDMSEYELEPAACDLSERSERNHGDLWNRLTGIVAKRPYSVILLDKIDKTSSIVTKILLRVLDGTTSDATGNLVDFSKSIIFLTSSVSSCTCYNRNQDLWKQFTCNPVEFFKAHDCTFKGIRRERGLVEVSEVFSTDLLDSLDKTLIVGRSRNLKAVMRLSLRDIVKEFTGERIVVHASNSALDALHVRASVIHDVVGRGNAFRKSVLEHVIPQLSFAEGHKNGDVYIDTLVGTTELSLRFQSREKDVDDWYFGLEDGTFDQLIANLRTKVETVSTMFDVLSHLFYMSDHPGQKQVVIERILMHLIHHDEVLTSPPIEFAYEKRNSRNVATNNLPTYEEKEKIMNTCKILQEINSGIAKAASVVLDAVVKIIDASLEYSDNFPARRFLFEGLGHDGKAGLVSYLNETLGYSLFTYVRLDTNSGEEVKNSLIEQVKRSPCTVLLFDGVEFYDDVLYGSLLKILDKGTLKDNEGFIVDFRKTIVILTSDLGNKNRIAGWFNYVQGFFDVAENQNTKRYRSELFNRIDEMIFFDPIMPEHGRIRRISKSDFRYPRGLSMVYWPGNDLLQISLNKFIEM